MADRLRSGRDTDGVDLAKKGAQQRLCYASYAMRIVFDRQFGVGVYGWVGVMLELGRGKRGMGDCEMKLSLSDLSGGLVQLSRAPNWAFWLYSGYTLVILYMGPVQ